MGGGRRARRGLKDHIGYWCWSLASSVSPESLKVSKEMSSTCWGSGKGLPAGHNAQGMMGGSDVCVGVPRGAQ